MVVTVAMNNLPGLVAENDELRCSRLDVVVEISSMGRVVSTSTERLVVGEQLEACVFAYGE